MTMRLSKRLFSQYSGCCLLAKIISGKLKTADKLYYSPGIFTEANDRERRAGKANCDIRRDYKAQEANEECGNQVISMHYGIA